MAAATHSIVTKHMAGVHHGSPYQGHADNINIIIIYYFITSIPGTWKCEAAFGVPASRSDPSLPMGLSLWQHRE